MELFFRIVKFIFLFILFLVTSFLALGIPKKAILTIPCGGMNRDPVTGAISLWDGTCPNGFDLGAYLFNLTVIVLLILGIYQALKLFRQLVKKIASFVKH